MSLFESINHGIKEAIRSKDQLRLETLRMLKAKIIAVDARGNLSDAEIVKLFKTYASNLQEAIEQAQMAKREEMEDKLKKELAIVGEFLPKSLSKEETEKLVIQAIEETKAHSKKELGIVMKKVMSYSNLVDGKTVKEIIESKLI
jgi:hypothetical protein